MKLMDTLYTKPALTGGGGIVPMDAPDVGGEIVFTFEEGFEMLSSLDRPPRVIQKLKDAYESMQG